MHKKKILIVDDSKSSRYVLRQLLQKHDFDVSAAESGEIALEILTRDTPDAIFMDHMMPGMNGFEATEAIKNNPATSSIPVVMCTSNDSAEYVAQAKSLGAIGILSKPPAPDKLHEIISIINQEQSANEPIISAERPSSAKIIPAMDIKQLVSQQLEASLSAQLDSMVEPLVKNAIDTVLIRLDLLEQGVNAVPSPYEMEEKLEAMANQLREQLLEHSKQNLLSSLQEPLHQLRKELDTRLSQLNNNVGNTLSQFKEDLIKQLPNDTAIVKPLAETVEALAEAKALETANRVAEQTAEVVASEAANSVLENISHASAASRRLILGSAISAALAGVGSAAAVYFMLSGTFG